MTKRASDLLITSVLLLVTLPVLLITAFGSALVLRAWPFFTQQRVGLGGETFRFLKVRTLPLATPAYLTKHQLSPDRIPRFTRVLRNMHFDELPQLLLVLTGRMSLVGPRPEMRDFNDRLDPAFAAERTSVRPGCTGLWQVSQAHTEMIGEAPEYDRFYIEHQRLRLDLWILWQTARTMVGLGERITLADVPRWAAPDAEPVVTTTTITQVAPATAVRDLDLAEIE
jgi:lipopolysaccharide/colanic/teichoic acid biosynthesis glycosyltransferase